MLIVREISRQKFDTKNVKNIINSLTALFDESEVIEIKVVEKNNISVEEKPQNLFVWFDKEDDKIHSYTIDNATDVVYHIIYEAVK